MQEHFGPAVVAIVGVLVGPRRIVQRQLVRDDDRGLCLAEVDEVSQPAVVGLYVALSGAELLSLEPELAEVEGDLAVLGEFVGGLRTLGDGYADYANRAGGLHGIDQRVHGEVSHLLAVRVVELVADALGAAVRPASVGECANRLADIVVLIVVRNRADLPGQGQPVGKTSESIT